jgi:Zn-finger nucleic acid-binding protein
MFQGAHYCQKCGAARTRTEDDETIVRCPGCAESLRKVAVGATVLLECDRCDGVWVDADVFERLCADRESQAAVLHRPAREGSATARSNIRYRPCARCGKMMNRVNFGRLSGAVVDVCKGHGTFLDPGELHQIVTFIQDGGLDRARERRVDDLREEARKLRDEDRKRSRERDNGRPGSRVHGDTNAVIDLINLMRDR